MTESIGGKLGDYRLIERIGGGGMGQVYLAEHVHLRKRYALKVLPAELARDGVIQLMGRLAMNVSIIIVVVQLP